MDDGRRGGSRHRNGRPAMGVGAPEGPPTASNASVKLAADEIDIVTTGPLLGLLPLLGIESIPVPGSAP